jgi:hypothetical protein
MYIVAAGSIPTYIRYNVQHYKRIQQIGNNGLRLRQVLARYIVQNRAVPVGIWVLDTYVDDSTIQNTR